MCKIQMANKLMIVVIIYQILTLANIWSQDEYILTITVTYGGQTFVIDFPVDKFLECLCRMDTESCTAKAVAQKATYIQEIYLNKLHEQYGTFFNRYLCEHTGHGNTIMCSKFRETQTNCSNTTDCWTYRIRDETLAMCSFGRVGIVWASNQKMEGSYIFDFLEINACGPECLAVRPPAIVPSERTPTSVYTPTKNPFPPSTSTTAINKFHPTDITLSPKILLPSASTSAPTEFPPSAPEVHTPSPSSTNSSNDKAGHIYSSDDESHKKGIIIGTVPSVVVVVVIVVLILVFIWRRRRSAFFAKSVSENSTTTNSTPTLLQLQHFDSTYANFTVCPAMTTIKNTDTIDDQDIDCLSTDGTEYEMDFSDYYDNSLSLEVSATYANENDEAGMRTYENYVKTSSGQLQDLPCNTTTNISCGSCVVMKSQEDEDGLLYEDLDCSGFQNAYSISHDYNDYSNVSENDSVCSINVDIHIEKISSLSQPVSFTSSIKNHVSSGEGDAPASKRGYSKLKEEVPRIKDSYNVLSALSDNKHQIPLAEPTLLPNQHSEPNTLLSGQRFHNIRTHDPVDVIDASHSQKLPIKSVSTDLSPSNDQALNDTCFTESTRSHSEEVLAQPVEKHLFGKLHEYFELERDYGSGINDVLSSVEFKKDLNCQYNA